MAREKKQQSPEKRQQAPKRNEKRNEKSRRNASPADEQGEEKLPAERNGGEPTRSGPTFRPRVDIYETDDGLVLLADMPGANPGSIDVNLDRRELTIRARIDEDEPEDMSVVHREYETGDFERHFQLAGDFDVERIEAKLKDGVLRLKLPKAPEQEARRIEVKAS